MFIVIELNSELIIEDRLGLLEGNSVLSLVRGRFGLIPLKLNHKYSVLLSLPKSSESPNGQS